MLTATQIAGFIGAGLAGAAYIPQISHLIRARCSAGISRLAFELWLLASLLTTARAIAIHAGVFIVLGGIQIVATTVIMIYATRYKNTPCPIHHPRQPGANTDRSIREHQVPMSVLSYASGRMRPKALHWRQMRPTLRAARAGNHLHPTHPLSQAITPDTGAGSHDNTKDSRPRPR
jgi:hypothetical protein